MRTAILASQNKNKIREIKAILEKYGLNVISRDDAGIPTDDIEETGVTFEENSYLKARTIFDMIRQDPALSEYLDSPVIADDSGLMVDAMNGAPGVFSARYAGEGCTYDDNNVKMLGEMKDVPQEERGAGFVTVITLIYPEGGDVPQTAVKDGDVYVLTARGELRGTIATERRGSEGFGYDPLFIPGGMDKTFAELGTAFKNTISHRARALTELERLLEEGR
jgi:XTP/dITP diphosphohydrolase